MTSVPRGLQFITTRAIAAGLGAVAMLVAPSAAAAGALTEGARLAGIYDTIVAGRFGEAEREIDEACPPAPRPACDTLRLVSVWWRIVLDPNSRAWDSRLHRLADEALASTEQWVLREPRRAEAWFYLAGARAPRVQWLVIRGERLGAAREGKRIKEALERALTLDPTLIDAHFGIGLYRYYADVVPPALKVFRWLLLLPGGDRVAGLRQMLAARERGELLRSEADFQLHWIYLWYERNPARAIDLLRDLDARFPSNPVFLQRIAEIQREYLADPAASAATWQTLFERAARDAIAEPRLADTRARLGLADAWVAAANPDRALHALEMLAPVRSASIDEVYSARALAHAIAGDAHQRLGARDRARDAYRSAIATAPDRDAAGARARAQDALRRNF
jgi:tetratricopeptide (TPR) repeat protein